MYCAFFSALICALFLSAPASARGGLCSSAKAALEKDTLLAEASQAAFPHLSSAGRDTDCTYPLQVLRYGDADVLLSTDDAPGEACHGCAATLSAAVMRRLPGRLLVVARFERFATEGTFGDPGRINGLQLAGHDAFSVESGGTFQGYTSSGLTFYVFHDGRLVEVKPNIPLSASNEGAATRDATVVDGAWHVSGGRTDAIVVDYKVSVGGRTRRTSATWALVNDALVLRAGRVPAELHSAGGN